MLPPLAAHVRAPLLAVALRVRDPGAMVELAGVIGVIVTDGTTVKVVVVVAEA
jgi:hypothetical protein